MQTQSCQKVAKPELLFSQALPGWSGCVGWVGRSSYCCVARADAARGLCSPRGNGCFLPQWLHWSQTHPGHEAPTSALVRVAQWAAEAKLARRGTRGTILFGLPAASRWIMPNLFTTSELALPSQLACFSSASSASSPITRRLLPWTSGWPIYAFSSPPWPSSLLSSVSFSGNLLVGEKPRGPLVLFLLHPSLPCSLRGTSLPHAEELRPAQIQALGSAPPSAYVLGHLASPGQGHLLP